MEKERPLVSIIVRTKDRQKLLERALQSITAQTYRPIEVVLVNDGGCELPETDLRQILGDISLKYFRLEENKGRAHAGNVGIKNAAGDYIGFLDDDDELYPEHVETLADYLNKKEMRVVYSDSRMVYQDYDDDKQEVGSTKEGEGYSQDFDYDMLVFENYIPFMCLMFDRAVLVNSEGFDTRLDLYEDWDLLINVGDRYSFHHVKKLTSNYNQWSDELQIAQRNRDQDFLKESYVRVMSKHIHKITPRRIHHYVSDYAQLKEFRSDFYNYTSLLNDREERISSLESQLRESEIRMKERDNQISGLESLVRESESRSRSLESLVAARTHQLQEKEHYIQLIHSGHGWKLLTKYFKARDNLLPEGSRRRLFFKLIFKLFLSPKEMLGHINKTNIRKFFYYLKAVDPLTVEEKCNQKLSYELKGDDNDSGQGPGHGRSLRVMDRKSSYPPHEIDAGGEEYTPLLSPDIPESDIRIIAFYLPQFHPIKENDEWWGRGFTEWTNVTRAVPQFTGHYQPRLPGELGFYDLRIPEVQQRQVELAKRYGVYGFCFHFYWFNGKTLLEGPLRQFAENLDFPFCINWANENWTRAWDGKDNAILISQKHSPEDDIRFIQYVSQYLIRKNYITIASKPLVSVYRPLLLPEPKATADRWREWCHKNGIGDIYLAGTHAFEQLDPEDIGFDAVIEFPPNMFPLKSITSRLHAHPGFKGVALDYKDLIRLSRNYIKPSYKKFRGICPSWDNEPRRPGKGTVLVDSTPDYFKKWLKDVSNFTHNNFDPDERLIFINAWNEWAEGAYLEPDRKYGYGYLQAVADAVSEYIFEQQQKKIIYACHDAHFHGAQILSLNILRILKHVFHYDVHLLLKSGGKLENEYKKYAAVYNLERDYSSPNSREKLMTFLHRDIGVREAVSNTVASGDLTELLHSAGIKTVSLVHELPGIIKELGIEKNVGKLTENSSKIVFPSDYVKEKFKTIANVTDEKTVILPQGLYKQNKYKEKKHEARKVLRENLSMPENAQLILGVGFGDHRKGIDLFIEVAKIVNKKRKDIYFLWVGDIHLEMKKKVEQEARSAGNVMFLGMQKDTSVFYAGSDMYLLTSREDPFPTVVLEAMDVGLPVIGFDEAGGFKDIVQGNTGILVPHLNVNAMAGEVIRLFEETDRRITLEKNACQLVEENFNFVDYVYKLLALLGHEYKKVSVILPNYNYEKYLKSRIDSILQQTYPVYEIIFLDDASDDNSVKVVKNYLEEGLNQKIVRNTTNSGSAFKQWLKGLQMARGDYIWIAEADDDCDKTFLKSLICCFERDHDVVLAYCQSKQMSEKGEVLSENYFEYTNDIDRKKWKRSYTRPGRDEIADVLAVKNTIPNVSAVLFRNVDISPIADDIIRYRIAGDWFFYTWLLQKGKVAYIPDPLNFHRRHDMGITKSEDKDLHYREIIRMQEHIEDHFDVSRQTRDKVMAYREYLKNYLGLKETGTKT